MSGTKKIIRCLRGTSNSVTDSICSCIRVLPCRLALSRFLFDIEIFLQNGTGPIEADITTAVTEYLETQEPFNEAIHFIRKDTISEGGISAVANDVANPQSATVTAVILTQVTPTQIVQSYQLFGGEFGKVNSITYTAVS